MQANTTGNRPSDIVSIVTDTGVNIELEVADVREIFYRVELWRGARRNHEQTSARRQQRQITDMVGEFGLTFEDARELTDWYSNTIYNPKLPWTCPL